VIVALESASSEPSLAITGAGGELIGLDSTVAGEGRASQLAPRLQALLDGSGLELRDVSALAVGIGPGSFTGLRVAMSLAKGLAFALGRPLVGVPSLDAWLAAEPRAAAALVRAGAHEAWLRRRADREVQLVRLEGAAAALYGPVVIDADTAAAAGVPLPETGIPPARAAAGVALLAVARLAVEPGGDDLARLEPAYLRRPRGIPGADEPVLPWR